MLYNQSPLFNYSFVERQLQHYRVTSSTAATLYLVAPSPIDTDTTILHMDILIPELDTLKAPLTITGVGDMMLGTNYPSASFLPTNNGKNLLTDVIDILKNADVTFGNMEGTPSDEGGEPKTCLDSSICYLFRIPAKYVDCYVEAGFDLVSIANNHSGDFGAEGQEG